jgi:SAM-dependent methyltransferase
MYAKAKLWVMEKSRNAKLQQFYSRYGGGKVLDVGVSGNNWSDMENVFLKNFRGRPADYTALGIEDLDALAWQYPDRKFVQYPGGRFPFADGEFEWAYSNAVIEHVGDRAAQVAFLNEMLRVAKRVFFTTPNKWFPIESHTNVLLLHYFPDRFYRWCAKRDRYWTPETLNLLGGADLADVLARSDSRESRVIRNRLGGLTMTFSVICTAQPVGK